MTNKPTIQDVAKKAGVSIATVSRVINQLGGVRKATEERILKAIDELQYIRSAVARSMIMKKTKTIGIIVPDINNPFFPLVVSGVEQKARERGYFTFLCSTNESVDIEDEILKVSLERGVDGLIITPANESGAHLKILKDQKIPTVAVDRTIHSFNVDTVLIDNELGAYEATKHLIQQGHQSIATICGPLNTTPGYERYKGYKKALDEFGIEAKSEFVLEGNFMEYSGYELTRNLYDLQERPSAIFVANNLMSIGCIKALSDLDWQLGIQVGFVGFDDVDIATFTKPALTVVSRPMRNLGEIAFQLLDERMNMVEEQPARKFVLAPHLVVRDSSKKYIHSV